MRIEYENTFIDILLFNMAHQLRSPVMQGFMLLVTTFVAWNSNIYQAIASYIVIWLLQFIFNCAFFTPEKTRRLLPGTLSNCKKARSWKRPVSTSRIFSGMMAFTKLLSEPIEW